MAFFAEQDKKPLFNRLNRGFPYLLNRNVWERVARADVSRTG
jgi:hypothetical protein